jgi:phosphoenolpyruvate-protein kinase (PTS system EI component)
MTTDFKNELIAVQKRLSAIRARAKTEIAEDLSNLNKLDDLIVQLSGDCEDITWDIIQMKVEAESLYYEVLNKIAGDYNERELPVWAKANADYQRASRRLMLLDHLLGETNRTQQTVNNRRYGLTNAVRARQFVAQVSTGS